MVVASVLMSMGMMMMSPAIVSLPFKIMLFVLVDGWNLLIASSCKASADPAMTPTTVIDLGRQALELTLLVSAPLFIAALVTGLIISIFQAATQINEQTLSFVPKLIATFITLVLAGPWMITMMTDFIRRLFESIPSMIG
jgi:flagellar biosynthetic protein FliQ